MSSSGGRAATVPILSGIKTVPADGNPHSLLRITIPNVSSSAVVDMIYAGKSQDGDSVTASNVSIHFARLSGDDCQIITNTNATDTDNFSVTHDFGAPEDAILGPIGASDETQTVDFRIPTPPLTGSPDCIVHWHARLMATPGITMEAI